MSRKIIQIDENKCIGCGMCANACKQNTIEIVNGKAKVMHQDYCDGLGNCLPVCPVGAISFSNTDVKNVVKPSQCPSTQAKTITISTPTANNHAPNNTTQSALKQWPVQIKLAPTSAQFYQDANLLIAADCTAYAYANFHQDFMQNKVTLIGCSKLDNVDYTEKLTEIIKNNNIKSLTIVKMEVPCCTGIQNFATNALKNSGKFIPWQVVTISTSGQILES